ncbi:formate dehydrogenase accessory sulfurtransferase FdhD [Thiomonas sp.]|jgi:FdhD protein|uniref:formate dehydrogenase accessory sulfurtransferase FdhD n=1 Tax=Thiomonas sp. TaxID=2047785 RepID=UPI002626BBDA|nr:formate dehydrogenase accessory sulfurtransferase FdhD [Thiomonas sp.]
MDAKPLPLLPGAASAEVLRVRAGRALEQRDRLCEEVAVALEFNGISHAVMLATPADLEDFALGFALTEGIVEHPDEVFDIAAQESAQGITLRVDIASRRLQALKLRRRSLAGRTGCGLCGTDSLEQALRPVAPVGAGPDVAPAALARAVAALRPLQPLFEATGSVHAAALCSAQGEPLLVREDVGRHNALDKLIGGAARGGLDARDALLVISSRASIEMVQKAATLGCAVLAAVSAPTALAVRAATGAGMTLVGRIRGDDMVVYCGAQRLRMPAGAPGS